MNRYWQLVVQDVSIHAPLRGATGYFGALDSQRPFQSTHPCGVRLTFVCRSGRVRGFQSTHPCGVRHWRRDRQHEVCDVSIHAPLRGATIPTHESIHIICIVSIHAPLRGATFPLVVVSSTVDGFNPRTPAGCDYRFSLINLLYGVSIHAPLRGATQPAW